MVLLRCTSHFLTTSGILYFVAAAIKSVVRSSSSKLIVWQNLTKACRDLRLTSLMTACPRVLTSSEFSENIALTTGDPIARERRQTGISWSSHFKMKSQYTPFLMSSATLALCPFSSSSSSPDLTFKLHFKVNFPSWPISSVGKTAITVCSPPNQRWVGKKVAFFLLQIVVATLPSKRSIWNDDRTSFSMSLIRSSQIRTSFSSWTIHRKNF